MEAEAWNSLEQEETELGNDHFQVLAVHCSNFKHDQPTTPPQLAIPGLPLRRKMVGFITLHYMWFLPFLVRIA